MKRTILALVAVVATLFVQQPSANAITISDVYHWPYSTVYVEDHTQLAHWPVYKAVRAWDYGTDVRVRYGACRANAGCVTVKGVWWGKNGIAGQTFITYSNKTILSAHVKLNNSYGWGWSWTVQLDDTDHELGHALGLEYHRYNPATKSCMYYSVDAWNPRPYPSAGDRYWLNKVY